MILRAEREGLPSAIPVRGVKKQMSSRFARVHFIFIRLVKLALHAPENKNASHPAGHFAFAEREGFEPPDL